MAISAAVLDAMLKAGCSAEQLVAVVRADEEANKERLAEKREKNRIRQRNHRERNALRGVTTCDERDLSSPEGSSPTPPSPKPHQSIPPSPPKGGSSPTAAPTAEFENLFWPAYPHKVGKPVALSAFLKARSRADLETIMAGLRLYVAKTDDRPWCNASTWLNQDRWNDQPAVVARGQPPPRERDLADLFNERAQQLRDYDDGRTIEGSYERGDYDGPRQAVPRLASSQG